MNNKARLALADKVQNRVRKQLPHYQIIRKRDEIEKEFNNKRLSVKSDFQIVREAPKQPFVGESMVGIVRENGTWGSIPPPTPFFLTHDIAVGRNPCSNRNYCKMIWDLL